MADTRLQVAKEFLADAKLCLDNGRFRSATSRSYYAVFHACIALFERFGYIPSNFRGRGSRPARRWEHRIVTFNFHIEFVQNKKMFPWRISSQIRMLYNNRIDADYKPRRIILESQATERLKQARGIIEQIERAV